MGIEDLEEHQNIEEPEVSDTLFQLPKKPYEIRLSYGLGMQTRYAVFYI